MTGDAGTWWPRGRRGARAAGPDPSAASRFDREAATMPDDRRGQTTAAPDLAPAGKPTRNL